MRAGDCCAALKKEEHHEQYNRACPLLTYRTDRASYKRRVKEEAAKNMPAS